MPVAKIHSAVITDAFERVSVADADAGPTTTAVDPSYAAPPHVSPPDNSKTVSSIAGTKRSATETHPETAAETHAEMAALKTHQPNTVAEAYAEQNTQIELTESSDPLRTVVDRFEKQLELCRKHYNAMQWLRLARQTDIRTFTADELLIFTDFASTVDLKAACTDNSSQDAHAVLAIFVVLMNRRDIFVTQDDGSVFKKVSMIAMSGISSVTQNPRARRITMCSTMHASRRSFAITGTSGNSQKSQ